MPEIANTDATLAGQAAKLRAILESAVDAILTIDANGSIRTVNPAAERLFGYTQDEFLGRNVHFLMPEPYHSEHDEYLRAYRSTGRRKIIGIGREVVGRRADGSHFPIHLAVSEFEIDGETQFAGIIRDLSDHKETELALREVQKMEAMGQLTGGIAHDFNNLLTVIIGNLEMLDMRLKEESHRELANEALEAAEVGSRLTARLLAFARRSHLEPKSVNLNTFVLDLTDMLHRTLGETILLSSALSPSLWTVRADASQIESAIVNLAVNARDAMPDGGRLVIETANVEFDDDGSEGLAAGEYVRLSVSDTGSGMPPAVLERAFEPFFTTKEKGQGTGLGLSMIYGFARQSRGHAAIYSELGQGTTVSLYLPRHREIKPEMHAPLKTIDERGRGQLILAVEDDERLRRLTVARLEELGYRVLEAHSGAAAMDVLAAYPEVELLFTDLVMPGGMSGYDLSTRARELFPGLKCLLTSGYAEELTRADKLTEANLKVLRKPYRMAELAEAIAEAL
ncbi:PAS domain S-box protein [Pelagibacterium montanilacus]|uniref:PAS domain S-box protein n=1 Tax=Pelagibacterium montanilacus TaxID=2185280 RepID=UPI000F8EBD1C|nr:PAS domain S-box protein [Pelagibacterium montanilacus]